MNRRYSPPASPPEPASPRFQEGSRKARWSGWVQSFSGLEWLALAAASAQVVAGIMLTAFALTGQIEPLFLSGICSMLGCVSTMLGGFQWYVLMRRHRHGGHVLRDALNRMLKDHN